MGSFHSGLDTQPDFNLKTLSVIPIPKSTLILNKHTIYNDFFFSLQSEHALCIQDRDQQTV